jgi:hypothetical protein
MAFEAPQLNQLFVTFILGNVAKESSYNIT